jgi:hypothetical protein
MANLAIIFSIEFFLKTLASSTKQIKTKLQILNKLWSVFEVYSLGEVVMWPSARAN